MPELPEVESARRLAEEVALGHRVDDAWCADDPIVFEGLTAAEARENLQGRRIEAVHRHGKHLWLTFDQPPHPLFHFGMTGALITPDREPLRLASAPEAKPDTWPPRFCKLSLTFDDGSTLAFTNARRLGRVRFRQFPEEEAPLKDLGFDPLLAPPEAMTLVKMLKSRKRPLKALLLDQSFAAGVGNWIADEVLYQARLDPRRPANTLTTTETHRLRSALVEVVRIAVDANADKNQFPSDWLFHHRWRARPGARTSRGEVIERITVAGRTTAWVPKRQR